MAANSPCVIRPLAATDIVAFRDLRLNAITLNPECFCTALSEAEQQDIHYYQALIRQTDSSPHQALFGAFSPEGKLLGVIGLERMSGTLRAHRARLWGLITDTKYRRQGIARQLCTHAINQARSMSVEKLSLELTGEAVPALHLYRSLGFRIESVEPLALKLDDRYLDEIRMALCF